MTERAKAKAQIERWRNGAEGFLNWIEDVKPMIPSDKGGYEPYVPDDIIKAEIRKALDGGFHTLIFCWPRRHGKTVICALIIAWRFLTRKTQTIAIVANSERQSVDTAFKLVKTILEQTPYMAAMITRGLIVADKAVIRYDQADNVIQGFPAAAASLYGKKLSVAMVSELHAARDDEVYQVCASSTIDTRDGLTLADSTVGGRNSPLFPLYKLWEDGADPSLYVSYIAYPDLEEAIAKGPRWIDPKKLRSRATQMLPAVFAQQHLNQWGSGTNSLFPAAAIEQCRESYAMDVPAITAGAAHVVGAGLDRAYGFSLHGDATVSTCVLKVLQGEEEHYYVLASDKIAFSSAGGIKKAFTRYRSHFGMSKAAIESYNAQDIAAWCGDQSFDHELVSATLERQANAFTALYNAAAEGRLHLHPAFERLFSEMATFEYELVSNGAKGTVPRFGHAKGCHDDHVYSLAWALYALRDIELNPYEVAGIHCFASGPAPSLCLLNGGGLIPPCADGCRSFIAAKNLYEKYKNKTSSMPMKIEDFVNMKLINTGSHSMPR